MVQKKNIGFIGFGRVVEWHLNQLKNLNIEVIFICDIADNKIENAKEIYPKANFFKSIDMLLDNDELEIDYCVIATPSGSHFDIAKEISKRRRSWRIIIEKPTFLNYIHFEKAKSWGSEIIPIFQNRYNQSVIKAKKLIENGKLGKLHYASLSLDWCRPQRYFDQADWRGTWLSDGGVSTNQGIHYFDITRHLLGDFIDVRAYMKRIAVDIECEDYLSAFFNLKRGIPLDVRMSTSGRHTNEIASLSINGSLGSINLHGICCNKLTTYLNNEENESYDEEVEIAYGYGHRDFFKLISGESSNPSISLPTLTESLNTMKYIFSSYESAISGKISKSKDSYKNIPLGTVVDKKIDFHE